MSHTPVSEKCYAPYRRVSSTNSMVDPNFLDPIVEAWLEWLPLSSIPLRKFSPDGATIGTASSCLVNFRDRRFILTVTHAVLRESTRFGIELGVDAQKGTEIYFVRGFEHVMDIKRFPAEIIATDFSYASIHSDISPVFQLRTPHSAEGPQRFRHVFEWSNVVEPEPDETYGFSGAVFPEMHGSLAMVTTTTNYPGLRYCGTEAGFHKFRLPVPHPGHEHF